MWLFPEDYPEDEDLTKLQVIAKIKNEQRIASINGDAVGS